MTSTNGLDCDEIRAFKQLLIKANVEQKLAMSNMLQEDIASHANRIVAREKPIIAAKYTM